MRAVEAMGTRDFVGIFESNIWQNASDSFCGQGVLYRAIKRNVLQAKFSGLERLMAVLYRFRHELFRNKDSGILAKLRRREVSFFKQPCLADSAVSSLQDGADYVQAAALFHSVHSCRRFDKSIQRREFEETLPRDANYGPDRACKVV